jgi:hypothetical protein
MKPENHDDESIRDALQDAFPAVDTELRRDLWPAMLRRLESPPTTVPWYDWVLAGCLVAVVLLLPKSFLLIAYHL